MNEEKLSSAAGLELVKLLIQIAWSDYELAEAEKGYIRGLVHRLELDDEHGEAVEQWLAGRAPLAPPDLGLLKRNGETVMRVAAGLIFADGEVVEDERAMIQQLAGLLSD